MPILLIVALLIFSMIAGSNSQKLSSLGPESATTPKLGPLDSAPTTIPPSLVLLAGGARWATQTGNSTLFIDWEDNFLAHGNTDGISWGPWPSETDMKNWTQSIDYVLNQSGLDVHLAGDLPDNLTGYDLLVLHAYWAVEPRHVAMVEDFIANGGGVVILSGVPEFFRTYCKDMWTYLHPTDTRSLNMSEYFGCDGNYVNTGGYANVTVDNPFGSVLMTGDTLIEGAGPSNAGVLDPHNGSLVVAQWELGVALAYTYAYGAGRVYYQATFVSIDPPSVTFSQIDVNMDGKIDGKDIATIALYYGTSNSTQRWSPIVDVNNDGKIDGKDITLTALHFGEIP
jgi:hypothetical protein